MGFSGKQAQDWVKPVLYIGAGILAWKYGAKPLLETLGLKDSQADKDVAATENLPAAQDYWNPGWYKLPRPAGAVNIMLSTQSSANAAVELIKKSLGGFVWLPGLFLIPTPIPKDDNEEAIYGLFRNIKYKSQISFLAAVFYQNTKVDLYQFIKNYFTNTEMATLLTITNKKPWGYIRANGTIY